MSDFSNNPKVSLGKYNWKHTRGKEEGGGGGGGECKFCAQGKSYSRTETIPSLIVLKEILARIQILCLLNHIHTCMKAGKCKILFGN